jgi:hypothetical protein
MIEQVVTAPAVFADRRAADRLGREEEMAQVAIRVEPAAAVVNVSGLYKWKLRGASPFTREDLRLDVDGVYPQMVASGTGYAGLSTRVHWIAKPLTATMLPDGTRWSGPIFYKDGNTNLFPYTQVSMRRNGLMLEVTFAGGGVPERVRSYEYRSPAFHPVEFEYDTVQSVAPVTDIRTHDHPDRPATLPNEILTIETVYRRAGFDVTRSAGGSIVPLEGAGTNERWSDSEMHDAMEVHWTRFADRPRWALWTFFADLHEDGEDLGGIMFDSIGPNHRQGTALFLNSFIAQAPPNDPAPDAWVRRMVFWTAVHEMGHAFNLAHAWDKADGPWIPMSAGFDQLTFMNYPFLYQTGSFSNANTVRFFRAFPFRFTDEELLFLRHAPARFVQMGNADWFDHHGFEQADESPAAQLRLTVRANRKPATFEFMEPVVVELKLTNDSDEPLLIPEHLLQAADAMTVIVQRKDGNARRFVPYAHRTWHGRRTVLAPKDSLYESLFLSAGVGGWLIDEPGQYLIQVCLHLNGEDVVSDPLIIRVTCPQSHEEENLAQDFFSDEVGRVLTYDGTRVVKQATSTLEKLAKGLPGRKVAIHANIALAMPLAREHKVLELRERTDGSSRGRVRVEPADVGAARLFTAALGQEADAALNAAEALGHIDYHWYAEQHCKMLERMEKKPEAQEARQLLYQTLVDRKVLNRVLDDVRSRLDAGEEEERKTPRGRGSRGGTR